jgi:hypothetical protein
MDVPCSYCGYPAVPDRPDPPWCARCWEWYAEDQRRWAEVQASGGIWNPSQDDPWCRHWLLSRELFVTYHHLAPRLGERVQSINGGELFAWGIPNCQVLVWVSSAEVVVGYGTIDGFPEPERRQEFEGLVHHLRHSGPLELGKVRGWSSYGAVHADRHEPLPQVKWAQYGDWAAFARNAYVGRGGSVRDAAPGSNG